MYQPSAEQAEQDRQAAYEAGVPHGQYVHSVVCVDHSNMQMHSECTQQIVGMGNGVGCRICPSWE